jgi:hypothetical protein
MKKWLKKDVWEEMRSFCCFISVLRNVAMPQQRQSEESKRKDKLWSTKHFIEN